MIGAYKKFVHVLSFVCFVICCLILTSPVKAAGDFLVTYNVDYTISEQGQTRVQQDISLLNRQTNLYAREYSIIIDSTKIKNVAASDKKGKITPVVSSRNGKTEIRVTFNEEVVGQGNILRFQISYEDENIAKKNGSVWEVTIPGIADDPDLGDYTVQLHVPSTFGPPAYLVPEPEQSYRWGKKVLVNGGVSGAFGKEQVFDLTLSYFLENTKSVPIVTEIALPPTSAYQYVTVDSLEPQPDTIVPDEDGNWLARYTLDSQSNKIVRASLTTQLFLSPRSGHRDPIPDTAYLQGTEYWNIEDPEIKKIAKNLKTPRDVYDYVVNTLEYDYSRVGENLKRKGAVEALKDPKNSVCMEFTDLFVTLARAAGIPARQSVGYAFTTNPKLRPLSLVSDILHAWPEYFDKQKNLWIPVDPTWANTTGGIEYFDKLDFNHVVFAFNGKQDSYPYPAGFYRQAGSVGKDVEVRFRDKVPNIQSANLTAVFDFPKRVVAGINTTGQAVIRNTGNVAAEDAVVTVESADFGFSNRISAPVVPPFGVVSVPFSVKTSSIFTTGSHAITASINGQIQEYPVDIIPAYHIIVPVLAIIIWICIFIAVFLKRRKKV